MKRRPFLFSLATTAPGIVLGKNTGNTVADYENPYEAVDWDKWETTHSMSHQHQGMNDASRELFHAMGYRHFAFSNYYPSQPTPLSDSFRGKHPEIVWAPNAEQHSFLDSGLHFNSLGSRLATGYGSSVPSSKRKSSPIEHRFDGLQLFNEDRPWEGVYRLDLRLKEGTHPDDKKAVATLTIQGANSCNRRENFADEGPVENRSYAAANHSIYLRATSGSLAIKLDFDPANLEVTQLRLMQGTNRPWRDVFSAALDGEPGGSDGGLLYPEGGGITLNHPGGKRDQYLEMLDFDPRVLGIEVWNQLASGFGSDRGYVSSMTEPPSHFYQLWDDILATGRRCWGFFVKDHNTYGRGRNILLSPPLDDLSPQQREATLLRSYRRGTFFGSVAAVACNEQGQVVAPYDKSDFRFRHIRLRRDGGGRAVALHVAVTGNDENLRPNIQVRFITDQGIASIADASEAVFKIPSDPAPRFIRVEAFAYPNTHQGGKRLDPETVGRLDVAEVAHLHDRFAERGPTFFGNPSESNTPIPIVDQIFSQPIRKL